MMPVMQIATAVFMARKMAGGAGKSKGRRSAPLASRHWAGAGAGSAGAGVASAGAPAASGVTITACTSGEA